MTFAVIFAAALTQAVGTAAGNPSPEQVLTSPGGGLAAGMEWARRTARDQRLESWWVGWTVPGDTTGQVWHFIDRKSPAEGSATFASGGIRFTGSGLNFTGVPLRGLVPPAAAHETAVLLRFISRGNDAELVRVHTASFAFPVHFGGGTLLWLGSATDAESVTQLRTAFDATPDADLRRDVVGSVGAHRTSSAVAPVLRAWLEDDGMLATIRRESASWLGHHPHADAVSALTRVAQRDTSINVRTTSARALARAAEPRTAVDVLSRLARDDANARVRREAVAALGTIRDDIAFRELVEFVEQPGDSARNSTRGQAISTLAHQAGPTGPRQPQEVIDLLARIARNDNASSVRSAAVETLANLRDPRAMHVLIDIANNHTDTRLQQRATTGIARTQPPSDAEESLRRIAWEHPKPEVQSTAVRALTGLRTENARKLLADIAERHERPEVRRAALQAALVR